MENLECEKKRVKICLIEAGNAINSVAINLAMVSGSGRMIDPLPALRLRQACFVFPLLQGKIAVAKGFNNACLPDRQGIL